MGGRTDAADTLGQAIGITRVSSLQDYLKTAEERACAFGLFDDAVVYHGLDSEVALNPRYWVNLYFCDHVSSSKVIFSYIGDVPSGNSGSTHARHGEPALTHQLTPLFHCLRGQSALV